MDNEMPTEDKGQENELNSSSELEVTDTEPKPKRKRKKSGRAVLVVLAFILLAMPSVFLYLAKSEDNANEELRAEMSNYLVFSYALHLRSYWAMSNIDNAFEAASNEGDYGLTTMYLPLYIKRAKRQVTLAQEEIDGYNGTIPIQARTSYNLLRNCFNELEDLTDEFESIPTAVVPYGELVSDSVITTWTARQAVRVRFDLLQDNLRSLRSDAVSSGYEWVYEDMRLKATYDIKVEPGQTMFSSSSF